MEDQPSHSWEDNPMCLHSPGGRRGGWPPFQTPESQEHALSCRGACALGMLSHTVPCGWLYSHSVLAWVPFGGRVRENLNRASPGTSRRLRSLERQGSLLEILCSPTSANYTLTGLMIESTQDGSASLCQPGWEVWRPPFLESWSCSAFAKEGPEEGSRPPSPPHVS